MRLTNTVLAIAMIAGVVTTGCDREPGARQVQIGELEGPLAKKFEDRFAAVLEQPDVDRAFDELLEAVAADPALGQLGDELLAKLSADPAITAGIEHITTVVGEAPEIAARVSALMAEHPEMSPDQIGEAFGAEFEKAYEELLLAPVEDAARVLLDEIDVDREMATFQRRLAGKVGASLDAYFASHAVAWGKRLIELNGGKFPDRDRAAALYIEHAWSEARIAQAVITLCRDPALRREVTRALREAVALPSVQAAVIQAAHDTASDPAVIRAASAAMLSVLRPAGAGGGKQHVDAVFAAPSIRTGATAIARAVLTDPAVVAILEGAMRRAATEPSMRAAFDQILNDW